MSEVAVGRLIRARGRRGELIAEIYSSQEGRAEKLKEVMLDQNGRRQAFRVEEVWHHDGRPVFKFAGIDSIDDAGDWAGADMLVPEAERAKPEAGEYSYADLIGCAMLDKRPIGTVTGVEEERCPPLLEVGPEDAR